MVALPPLLSVPVVGGPIVPVLTVNWVDANLPFLSVEIRVKRGLEQETGTGLPATLMVG